jgi:16S rRNA (uracil1498-N3)-methyltransferase
MELFYAYEVTGRYCRLDAEESGHCVRVLRHRAGDEIDVIDGLGTLYHCRLTQDSPKGAEAEILDSQEGFGSHPYHLTLGCCPTKNNDRFEWFVEKATELGVDRIVPLIGEHSERKVYKTERAQRIALAATKQSLKARIPEIAEPQSVRSFVAGAPQDDKSPAASLSDPSGYHSEPSLCHSVPSASHSEPSLCHSEQSEESLRLIAYCFEDPSIPRRSIREVLETHPGREITVLIGPEGDFSPEEARLALEHGYIPIHLGPSRLRTETAAVTAVEAVYLWSLSI